MNEFIKNLQEQANKTETQNGAITHKSTLDFNLDFFASNLRYKNAKDIKSLLIKMLNEDKELAIKNVFYLLDIRNGKGERKASKIALSILLNSSILNEEEKKNILKNIAELSRWDYLIELNNKPYVKTIMGEKERYLIELIKQGINDNNLLLFKWMPSLQTKKTLDKKNVMSLIKHLGFKNTKDYRLWLTSKREPLNLIESNLTKKEYEKIDLSKVPAKAFLQYNKAIKNRLPNSLEEFLESVKKGESKINTKGLFPYEIIKKLADYNNSDEILDSLWKNQINFVPENVSAIVVADTSGSMYGIPLKNSIGLAMYFAERNVGVWQNKFITFSEIPSLVELPSKGTIREKFYSFRQINANTDIDKVFELIKNTALQSEESKSSMPEYLIIVSDMEFDDAQKHETNFESWENSFKEVGLKLPKIIFWNSSQYNEQSMPVVKTTKNVAMVSGFSTTIFENLFSLDKLEPISLMKETLKKYDIYL